MKKLLLSSLMLVMAALTVSAANKLTATASTNMSTHGANYIQNVTDGDISTIFYSGAAQAPDQYILMKLEATYQIGTITVVFSTGDKPFSSKIQYSTDNNTWYDVPNGTVDASGSSFSCDAGGVEAQYVRLYLTGSSNSWLQIAEFEVYEYEADKTATPVFNPGSQELSMGTSEDITITSEEGATIYYTLDGTEPTTESLLSISSGGTVSVPTDDWTISTTIKAIAQVEGKELSNVVTATYTVASPYCQPDVPTNGTGTSYVGQIVTLTTEGAKVNANWTNPKTENYNGHVGVIGNTFTAEAGQIVTLNITSKNTNWGAIRVYVDLNGNFDLTDEGENIARVGTTSDNSDTKAVNQEFTIDAATPAGTYLMRVFYVARSTTDDVEFNITDPCGEYAQGGYYDFAFNVVEPTVVTHTVTVEPAAIGEGTVTYSLADGVETTVNAEQEVSVTADQTITLTATAADGYKFVKWVDADGTELSTEATFEYTATGDVTISAVFEKEVYTVTLKLPATAEGTVKYSVEDGTEETLTDSDVAIQVTAGQTVTLTATAASGYEFVKWADGISSELSTNNPFTYTPTGDVTISAVFEKEVYTVTLKLPAAAEGTVEYAIADGEETAVDSEVAVQVTAGQTITLTATAADGYEFVKWVNGEGADLSTDNPYTYTPDADITISAVFAKEVYTVTLTLPDAAEGTVKYSVEDGTEETLTGSDAAIQVTAGQTITLTATAATGYKFSKWVDGEGADLSTDNPYTYTPDADITISAVFAKEVYTVTLKLPAAAEGTVEYAVADGEATTLDQEQAIQVTFGESITLTATAADGYEFVKWVDGDGTELSTEATFEYTPTGDVIISAEFIKLHTVTLTLPDAAQGTIKYSVDGTEETLTENKDVVLTDGQMITLTAEPVSGYKFVKWINGTSDELSTNNPYVYTPDADITISAVFAKDEATSLLENVASRFSAIVAGNCIKVSGVPTGEKISVYTINSVLVTSTVAVEGVNEIVVPVKGVLLVRAGDKVVKLVK